MDRSLKKNGFYFRLFFQTFCFFMIASAVSLLKAAHLTPLAESPDWSRLERFQETFTEEEFRDALTSIYLKNGKADRWIYISSDAAEIRTVEDPTVPAWKLRFAKNAEETRPLNSAETKPDLRKSIETLPESASLEHPLLGLKIVIDPGHLGGPWAKMEERWFSINKTQPIVEGDLTLQVAFLLEKKLKMLGANVYLLRVDSKPATPLRAKDLKKIAELHLENKGELNLDDPKRESKIIRESEKLFYRTAEIRARAQKIKQIKPDWVICLHFNAEEWGDPNRPDFSWINHLHLLINGSYTNEELAYDDVRFELLWRLLNRYHEKELAFAEPVVGEMAKWMELSPPIFPGGEPLKVGKSPYVWARNLLANRIYDAPVLYLEPYVMNHPEVFERVQKGMYFGKRLIGKRELENIFEEYAGSVAKGLVEAVHRR